MDGGGAEQGDRVANLDLLRATAIVFVLIFHLEGFIPLPDVTSFVRGWWCGVELFFVLSGYLIGGLILREIEREDRLQVMRFLGRRWLRTIPAYVVALLVVYALKRVITDEPFLWHYLLFIQNYCGKEGMPYFGVSWTLCVEEHFYLLLPLCLCWARRRTLGGFVQVIAGICVVVPLVSRLVVYGSEWKDVWYYSSHHHCAGLGIGLWVAWLSQQRGAASEQFMRGARWALYPSLAIVLFHHWFGFSEWAEWALKRTLLVLACGVMVLAAARASAWPCARHRWVKLIALSSYSTYLTHMAVISIVLHVLGGRFPAAAIWCIAAIACLATGCVFWLAVERPSLWLRERLVPTRPRRSTGGSADPPATG